MDIFSTPMSSFKKYGQGHGYKECDIALVMAKWEEHIEKLDKIDVETKWKLQQLSGINCSANHESMMCYTHKE